MLLFHPQIPIQIKEFGGIKWQHDDRVSQFVVKNGQID